MKNIANIELWTEKDGKPANSKPHPVAIKFYRPTQFTLLEISDLLKILELWIIGEEMRYPQKEGFRGRWLLFDKIKEVFDNIEVN